MRPTCRSWRITAANKKSADVVVDIHLKTFQDFFLTVMGKGLMYRSYCDHAQSGLLVALDDQSEPVGFLACSAELSRLYKCMIKKRLVPFAWYAAGAFFGSEGFRAIGQSIFEAGRKPMWN